MGTVQALEVTEEISRADAWTGCALMANSFSTGIAAEFMNDEGARETFGGRVLGTGIGFSRARGAFEWVGRPAHWCTLLVSVVSDGLPMHPRCRRVTALLA